LRNENVLDLGCGEGHYTRLFKKQTSGQVYGIDISANMIDLAKKQLKDS
jgi:ubiquinone/menaquinone biosynthesis C-methylase UbiE